MSTSGVLWHLRQPGCDGKALGPQLVTVSMAPTILLGHVASTYKEGNVPYGLEVHAKREAVFSP